MIGIKTVNINSKLDYLRFLSGHSNLLSELMGAFFKDIDENTTVVFDDLIPDEYIDYSVFDFLINGIGLKCNKIQVEYPYYDNDYLSVYYLHYSQKFYHYPKACYRIHFYSKSECYCGYMVLRPIMGASKIGKSFIAPVLFGNARKYILKSTFAAHVCGEKRKVVAFPWKHQETDVAVCAHTAIWNVLKYYGNKYPNYRDTTIGEIVDKAEESEGRKTPSNGLTPIQASSILKQYGFSPVIINQKRDELFVDFRDELVAYVESGLPIIAFVGVGGEHAITIIGHGDVDYDNISKIEPGMQKSNAVGINELIVMDDNYAPYRSMPVSLATQYSEVPYSVANIDYYVVPLYDRIHMEYRTVKDRLKDWLNIADMSWHSKEVYRIYLTSSKSLKEKTREDASMDEDIKKVILELSMPKFVWCIDFSTIEEYKKHLCSGRIIVDSTSEKGYPDSWIFRHDDDAYDYKDYDNGYRPEKPIKRIGSNPYHIYVNNLKEVP